VKLARIGSAGPDWAPDDMSGTGSAHAPGRWNRPGERVVYAAPTLAMAVLETAAHVEDDHLPMNKYVVELEVPDELWAHRRVITANDLPGGWDSIPQCVVSIQAGSEWYQAATVALLELPSAIIPEESIVLINVEHEDVRRIRAKATRRVLYHLVFR
jgi:RES domain-containing protein